MLIREGRYDLQAIHARARDLHRTNPNFDQCLSEAWREASKEPLEVETKLPAFVTGERK